MSGILYEYKKKTRKEAVTQWCSGEKVLLKFSHNLKETLVLEFPFNKVAGLH